MVKMRINELARELEVKPGVILELLPELGIQEKKTHSSTIEEEVVLEVRERLAGLNSAESSDEEASEGQSESPKKSDSVAAAGATAADEVGVRVQASETVIAVPQSQVAEANRSSSPNATAPSIGESLKPQSTVAPADRTVPAPNEGPESAPVRVTSPAVPPPVQSPQPVLKSETKKSVPTLPPPIPSKGKDRPIAPPLPPALRRSASPVTPPLGGGDSEGESGRRLSSTSPMLPPPIKLRPPTDARHSPFRHDEEKEATPAPESVPAETPREPEAPPAAQVVAPPSPAVPAMPGRVESSESEVSPAQPIVAERSATADLLPPPVVRAERPRQSGPGIPARPLIPENRRTAAPPATAKAPAPSEPEVSTAAPPAEETAGPRPGEILRGGPGQAQVTSTLPPTRVVVPGQNTPGLKPGEPIVGQEAARRFKIPEIVNRPAPGPARPPIPNRPAAVSRQVARPVVPPTPEMVERLKQMRPNAAAASPRPGAPRPRPGEPIYAGPVRPGQPMDRGRVPGRPSSGAGPGMAARGRGMHPTSSPLLPDTAPAPAAPGRKPAGGKRGADRGRRQEHEEKELAYRPSRRREPEAPPPITREITISEGVTVKELSEKLGVKASMVIKKLLDKKVFATINQTLDSKLAEEISRAFGASIKQLSYEEESVQDISLTEVEGDLEERPPVVTIMGHVDHGKTSLLDAIRTTNIADKEAGGITQHIGAYYVEKNGKKIVFVDTPGHAAFTRMRARGAKVTDIVVLVVAADDGIMPQTEEAINHAKAAGVPILVAINKVDKPGANLDRVKQQLTEKGLMPEDWGGETVTVPVSAKAGTNIDLLLEMILLSAEILELRANRTRPAIATVLEAQLDKGRGPVATVIVRNGTLRSGDYYICGPVFGRVRAMFDDRGNSVKEAGPSMPVEVLGLDSVPEVGDTLQVVVDTAKAKQIAVYRESSARELQMAKSSKLTLERFHTTLREGETKELLIVLKADVGGTAEVIAETLEKLSSEKVRLRVILSGVGAINESDILLASASNAIVVGFNVRPDKNATALADQEDVDIRLHSIIYELTDEVKLAMTGMLDPVYKEVFRGRAEVRDVFRISKVGTIAGCLVVEGTITRDSQVRLIRDNTVIHTGKLSSLKRFKDDASEVRTNLECGIGIDGYNDVKAGDVIEAFVRERVQVEAFA